MRTKGQTMPSAKSMSNQADDVIDVMLAIKRRVALAERDKQGRNKQANRLGTAITGGRGDGPQYADPTADHGFRIIEQFERGTIGMAEVKELAYAVAEMFEEWAEDRPADNGIRRCGEDDCAAKHHSLGLCQKHYRIRRRAEEAQRVAQQQELDRQHAERERQAEEGEQ